MAELEKLTAVSPLAVPGGGRTLRGRLDVHRATTTLQALGFSASQESSLTPKALDLKDTLFQGNRRLS